MKVEVSTGEVLDKISILEIKLHKIEDESKLHNVRREHLTLIKELHQQNMTDLLLSDEYRNLLTVNFGLWNIEDQIREKERLQEFDEEFVNLARSVYIMNDERAQLKRKINEDTNSLLIEEKSYESYTESNESSDRAGDGAGEDVDGGSSDDSVLDVDGEGQD